MLLGIDVGGTFTDAVVVDDGRVISHAKIPTTHGRLLECIAEAIDCSLLELAAENITRVALSTTIVTNAIVEKRIAKVGLLVIPGPGVEIENLVPVPPVVLSGYTDHRGREVAGVTEHEIATAASRLSECETFAISGKFANRNPQQELQAAAWLKRETGLRHITVGSKLTGTLNFWRRTNSAYYNAAVWPCFRDFSEAVEAALTQRNIHAPVYIVKADGGTMPLAAARNLPVEAIFTGPAASVFGVMTLSCPKIPAVSLDIGGTTTDIALWQNGLPLFAKQGIAIDGYPTSIRALRLRSVGIGGDSYVRLIDGKFKIGPERLGPAMALGGKVPTVSDAFIVAGLADFGERRFAEQAMASLGGPNVKETAARIIDQAARHIVDAIEAFIAEWSAEPVYRVEDIVRQARFIPKLLVGVGGAASGLVPAVSKKMGVAYELPVGGAVVNAMGAAVARPTLEVTLQADTAAGEYTVAECGIKAALPNSRFTMYDAQELSKHYLLERAEQAGIAADDVEIVQQEEFNVVRGFSTVGKIMSCRLQIKPGVLTTIAGFSKEEWQ